MGLEEKLKEVEETVSNKESKKDVNKGLLIVLIFVFFVISIVFFITS